MLKLNAALLIVLGMLLCSCGRHDSAFIVNDTGTELTITLALTDINEDPAKYFIWDIEHNATSKEDEYKYIGECQPIYDSIAKSVTLTLGPNEQLKLGTISMDNSRDNYSDWEFTEFVAIGRGIEIRAQREGMMAFVVEDKSIFTQDSHYLILGNQ